LLGDTVFGKGFKYFYRRFLISCLGWGQKGKILKIKNLKQTCRTFPSQWEASTIENRPVLIHYRHGYLSILVGPMNGSMDDAVMGEEVYGAQLGGENDGEMTWEEVGPIVDALPEMSGATSPPQI
jgi:hypothetical protein